MGVENLRHSEKNLKTNETELDLRTDSSKDGIVSCKAPSHPKTSTLNTLNAILGEVETSREEWPKSAFQKVLARFGRMPRTGWELLHTVYCEKFKVQTQLSTFRKSAADN